ncbi:MAG: hypothetical protein ACFBSE_26520 [Prochloraceae cyanobacterium]
MFAREILYEKFKGKIINNPDLNRSLVSFQANKQVAFSNWFKYREGFSESLVIYLLKNFKSQPGILLDPFSGSGSSLFAGSSLGWQTIGIELLPIGINITRSRLAAASISLLDFQGAIDKLKSINFTDFYAPKYALNHIKITRGAFPLTEEKELVGYLSYCHNFIFDNKLRELLIYAAFCILEDISYTRKDGQYLRWDDRAARSKRKKSFNKGIIPSFRAAIFKKLNQIFKDIQLNVNSKSKQYLEPILKQGSCLEVLPTLAEKTIDFVITSPPYLNRYDYTRTYAIELVFLGYDAAAIKDLRQKMLSCTVENKDKKDYLKKIYLGLDRENDFNKINSVFNSLAALQEILTILDTYKQEKKLNNPNIPKLVRNYFYEMCFIIYELSRILQNKGIIAMVNDNVRYAGEEIPVDLILSEMAASFGLTTKYIWTLSKGKGNSSQQMGNHGRAELRKCVYIWEKN